MAQNAASTSPESLPARSRCWRFASAVFDERTLELTVCGEPVDIERKPSEVLLYLLLHAGEVVTKDELLEAVWPRRILTETALTKCVARLREALGDVDQTIIKTLYGMGYRLVSPARVEASTAPPLPRFDFEAGETPPLRPHWKLLRRLGGGSHGEAWLAQHDKTAEQRVFKFALDADALVSLKREITLFRVLNDSLNDRSPALRLLDWNLEQPPCFIETQFIAGGSLTDWIGLQGGFGAIALSVRIDLAAQIAEALASAHSVGVLHKDLKPSNVLIDTGDAERPHVKLGDFGSGGMIDPDRLDALHITRLGFTGTLHAGEVTGTLTYLAPELLVGQPSTVQTDIYALGVISYQLVVGDLQRPLAPGWERDVDDELLREDIAAAADISPERRLGTAVELARRLRTIGERRKQLEDERRALSEALQARQEADRLRARRTGMRVALAILIVAVIVTSLLFIDAQRARHRAEVEASRSKVVSDFLNNDVLSVVSSGDTPVKDITVKQLLDTASKQADKRLTDDPQTAAAVDSSLGMSYYQIESEREALERWQKALALSQLSDLGVGDITLKLAGNLLWVANDMGSLPDQIGIAEKISQNAIQIRGPTVPGVLRLRQHIAGAHAELGKWSESADELASIVRDRETSGVVEGDALGRAHLSYGWTLADLAQFAHSEAELREAIKDLSPISGNEQKYVARAEIRLGEVLCEVGRYQECQSELQLAKNILEKWVSEDNGQIIMVLYRQGLAHLYQNELPQAETSFSQCLSLLARWKDGEKDISAPPREGLALAWQREGDRVRAISEMRDAASHSASALGVSHPDSQRMRLELVEFLLANNQIVEARSILASFGDVARLENLPVDHPLNAELLRVRGLLFEADGDAIDAAMVFKQARSIYSIVYGSNHWRTQDVDRHIGKIARE